MSRELHAPWPLTGPDSLEGLSTPHRSRILPPALPTESLGDTVMRLLHTDQTIIDLGIENIREAGHETLFRAPAEQLLSNYLLDVSRAEEASENETAREANVKLAAKMGKTVLAVAAAAESPTKATGLFLAGNAELIDLASPALLRSFTALLLPGVNEGRQSRHIITNLPDMRAFSLVRDWAENQPDIKFVAFDANGFKEVNDTLGHDAGDATLREIGRSLLNAARGSDVYHLHGDEFLYVTRDTDPSKLAEQAERAVAAALYDDNLVLRYAETESVTGDQLRRLKLGITGGVGSTLREADLAAQARKQARKLGR